ncbi:MAG: hypothetical protein U1F60_01535 [Planctomycetota bacterium]
MTRAAWLLLPLLGGAACVVAPRDPFARGHWALQRHDLGTALQAFDAVPVVHPRYPEARAAAVGVERTMRRCHELLLDALMLRGEWRDEEALAVLERARSIWPSMPGVDAWIAATQQRVLSVGGVPPQVAELPATPPPVPLLEGTPRRDLAAEPGTTGMVEPAVGPTRTEEPPASVAAAPQPEVGAPPAVEPTVVAEPPQAPPAAVAVAPVFTAASEDPVALALVSIEAQLRAGELASAVASLLQLADRHPGEVRIRVRLSRLLQQRALLRYGEGAVHEAIVDWQRVLELEPENQLVRTMLAAALREGERARRAPDAR